MASSRRIGWVIGFPLFLVAIVFLMSAGRMLHRPEEPLLRKLAHHFTTSYAPSGPDGGPFRIESAAFKASPSELRLINSETTHSNGWVRVTLDDGSISYVKETNGYQVVINLNSGECSAEERHKISPGAYIFRF